MYLEIFEKEKGEHKLFTDRKVSKKDLTTNRLIRSVYLSGRKFEGIERKNVSRSVELYFNKNLIGFEDFEKLSKLMNKCENLKITLSTGIEKKLSEMIDGIIIYFKKAKKDIIFVFNETEFFKGVIVTNKDKFLIFMR